ncbi:MAG: rod shape-determining protein MreD [Pseudomonadota bacterium]
MVPTTAALWRMALMVALGLAAILLEAAPVGIAPHSLPSPDLLALVVVIFAIRRPDAVPLPVVFVLGLTRDLLTDLPVGAGALALVLTAEAMRLMSANLLRGSLLREGLITAGVLLATFALPYLLALILFVQPPYVLAVVRQWVITVACWPAMLVLIRWGCGIRGVGDPQPRRRQPAWHAESAHDR